MGSVSQVNIEAYGFTAYWRIENFNCKQGSNLSIKSPVFKIKVLKSKWYLEIAEKENSLGVFLFKGTNPMCSSINFAVSLLTGSGWISFSEKLNYGFRAHGDGYGEREIVSLENLKDEEWNYLPNGALTVGVRIWNKRMKSESSQCLMISRLTDGNELHHRTVETFTTLKASDLLSFPHSYNINLEIQKALEVKSQFSQTDSEVELKSEDHLIVLFKEKKFAFITLRTSNREFFVHKAVLCANSPVFSAMLEKEMKENACNTVDIDDIDCQTMALLVKYLHLVPLAELKWDAAVTLYYAADKYQIDALKQECVSFMKKELSTENVCDAFLLADLHQDKNLMDCALEFFYENSKSIFLLSNWKDLLLSHSELVSEILYKLGEKM